MCGRRGLTTKLSSDLHVAPDSRSGRAPHPACSHDNKRKYKVFSCVCICATVCECSPEHAGASRGQRRVLDPLELESWVIVGLRVRPGNRTRVFCKSRKALNCRAIASAGSGGGETLGGHLKESHKQELRMQDP